MNPIAKEFRKDVWIGAMQRLCEELDALLTQKPTDLRIEVHTESMDVTTLGSETPEFKNFLRWQISRVKWRNRTFETAEIIAASNDNRSGIV